MDYLPSHLIILSIKVVSSECNIGSLSKKASGELKSS